MTYAANLAARLREHAYSGLSAEQIDNLARDEVSVITSDVHEDLLRAAAFLEGPPALEDAARGLVQQLRDTLGQMPLTGPRLTGTLHSLWGGVLDGIEMAVTMWAERRPNPSRLEDEPDPDPEPDPPDPVPLYGPHRAESEFLDALPEPPT